jgi:hypothetical protein
MAPSTDSMATILSKLEELGKKADETSQKIKGMQQSVQQNADEQKSLTAWKPDMEGKVTDLQNSMFDLKQKIDLFIQEIPGKNKVVEDLEASSPAHLGVAAQAGTSGPIVHHNAAQAGTSGPIVHHNDNDHRSVGARVVTTLVPPPIKGAKQLPLSSLFPFKALILEGFLSIHSTIISVTSCLNQSSLDLIALTLKSGLRSVRITLIFVRYLLNIG